MTWPGAPRRRPGLAPARPARPPPAWPPAYREQVPPAYREPPAYSPAELWPRPTPMPAPVPAEQRGTLRLKLSKNAKAVVAAIGCAITALAMIDGLGFIPADARDIFAILAAAATPVVIYFIPDWKPPGGTDGNRKPPHAAS